MGGKNTGATSLVYQIKVKGHLDSGWEDWFDGFSILNDCDGITTLQGAVVDQSALYGYLIKIHNLGLSLISINSVHGQGR
jgi:hypothetical protein